jgi:hypothetical protein
MFYVNNKKLNFAKPNRFGRLRTAFHKESGMWNWFYKSPNRLGRVRIAFLTKVACRVGKQKPF